MSVDLSLEQACVKVGVESDLLVGLARLSVHTGLAFKLTSKVSTTDQETNTYLVGNTGNQKAEVELVFRLGKQKISRVSVKVIALPESGDATVLMPEVMFKADIKSGNYQFGEIITPMADSILKELSVKLENCDLDFDSKTWGD